VLCAVGLALSSSSDEEADLTRSIVQREKVLARGYAELEITIADDFPLGIAQLGYIPGFRFLTDLMVREVGDGALLTYAWSDSDCWQINIGTQDDEAVRTIVFRETSIATGDGRIWEERFLTSYGDEPLHREFAALLWPFSVAGEFHLFPFTFGRSVDYGRVYSMFDRSVEVVTDSKGEVQSSRVLVACTDASDQAETTVGRDTIDVARGYALLRREWPMVGLDVVYKDLQLFDGTVWMPTRCVFALREDGAAPVTIWTSTLKALKVSCDDREFHFSLPTGAGIQRVPWTEEPARPRKPSLWDYLKRMWGLE